jgi:hypothetical protein
LRDIGVLRGAVLTEMPRGPQDNPADGLHPDEARWGDYQPIELQVAHRRLPRSEAALIILFPKKFRLFVVGHGCLDTLQAELEEVIECKLDRMTNP